MKEKVLDVVCNMWVDPDTAPAKTEYQDKIYYFCASGCKAAFLKEPDKYIHANTHQDHEQHKHHH